MIVNELHLASRQLGCRYLVEVYGFQYTFLLTAVLKAAGWFPLLPALFFVTDGVCTCGHTRPRKSTHQSKQRSQQQQQQQQPDGLQAAEQGRSEAVNGPDSIRQPLLQNGHHHHASQHNSDDSDNNAAAR